MRGGSSRGNLLRGRLGSLSLEDLPLAESSSSETISTTLLPLSRGAEGAPASTSARGTAVMGGGELGSGPREAGFVGFVGVVAG